MTLNEIASSLREVVIQRLPMRRITRNTGEPYLDRYYLFGPGRKYMSVFLHHIRASDDMSELHNHPFDAVSLVLRGGYYEDRLDERDHATVHRRFVRPFTLNVIRARTFHRIDVPKGGAWTLFLRGRRQQSWGFFDVASRKFRLWDSDVWRTATEVANLGAWS